MVGEVVGEVVGDPVGADVGEVVGEVVGASVAVSTYITLLYLRVLRILCMSFPTQFFRRMAPEGNLAV